MHWHFQFAKTEAINEIDIQHNRFSAHDGDYHRKKPGVNGPNHKSSNKVLFAAYQQCVTYIWFASCV